MWRLCDCSVCLSVSVCHSVSSITEEVISKFIETGVMTGPTNWKNLLTFGGALVPDTDSGSIFHFPHYCGIGGFRRIIGIYHTAHA